MTETVQQNGDPVGYQYNAQGLVTQETFADKTSETFTYDAHGNLLTAKTFDASGHAHRHHDADLQRRQRADLDHAIPAASLSTFTYNAAGQRTQSVDQSGFTVNYTYDALGRLSELTDGSGNLIVQYTYNNLGELDEKLNGNGTSTTYAYDAAGDLTSEVNLRARRQDHQFLVHLHLQRAGRGHLDDRRRRQRPRTATMPPAN